MAKMYFRYGAMNCGKTTVLLQVAHNYEEQGMKILLIKPSIDKKAGTKVSSRIGLEREVDLLLTANETIRENLRNGNISFDNLNCILVDEAQFLTKEQVNELWIISKLCDIPVICYGLKTNFKGELFEGSKAIVEKADTLEEASTICKCGNKARFNARLENGVYVTEGSEVAIDGIDAEYESLCGKCYVQKVLRIEKY
ncbi:MAG: thymidine kinase [Bacilli bacterium]|nr:thymidine kinase [Bacilli bacterium]